MDLCIKICCKSENGFLSYDRTYKQTHTEITTLYIWILNNTKSSLDILDKGVVRNGGGYGAKPPWTKEIYGFQGVFRPQSKKSNPVGLTMPLILKIDNYMFRSHNLYFDNLRIKVWSPSYSDLWIYLFLFNIPWW